MDNPKVKAQASIEFVISFVLLALFVVLAAKVFAWFESTTVNRHKAYERTRSTMYEGPVIIIPGCVTMDARVDFFRNTTGKRPMNIFNETE